MSIPTLKGFVWKSVEFYENTKILPISDNTRIFHNVLKLFTSKTQINIKLAKYNKAQ